jgi:hypothetical protein
MSLLRPITLAALIAFGGCRGSKPEAEKGTRGGAGDAAQAAPPKQGDLADAAWTAPMSNDLLQRWIGVCGQPSAAPKGEADTIVIWLGDTAKGTSCMLTYVQQTMTLRDIQVSTQAADPIAAQEAFVKLADDTLVPLLPTPIKTVVVQDIAEKRQYVSKPLGRFTAAMRNEVQPSSAIRWVWIHYAPPPG